MIWFPTSDANLNSSISIVERINAAHEAIASPQDIEFIRDSNPDFCVSSLSSEAEEQVSSLEFFETGKRQG
jgi:hypothetical protein